jgi:hypothetical protein
MSTLLIVESACVGAAYTGEAARALGYHPVFLTDPAATQGDTLEQIERYDHLYCDTGSVAAMAVAVDQAGIGEVGGVISLCDTSIPISIDLAQAYGARSINPIVKQLKNKAVVRDLIPDYSPPSKAFRSFDPPHAELGELAQRFGRIMVKPCNAAGGQGAFSVTDDELDTIEERIGAAGISAHLDPTAWLAQAFIDGPLISLEGFVADGTVTFFGFSGRRKVGMTETIVIFPFEDELSTLTQDRAKEAALALFSRAQFNNGYFHIEFMVDGEIPYVTDANIGRIGGGGLSQQFAISFGIEPVDLYRHILALSLEGEAGPAGGFGPRRAGRTWSVMYGVPVEAALSSVSLPDSFSSYHTRILDYGATVPPMGKDNYAWIGIVSGSVGTIERDVGAIEIATSAGSFRPVY